MNEEIESRFTYHPPKIGQPEKYNAIRAKARELAECITQNCEGGFEEINALDKLDECVMWANASIARNG